MTKQEFIARQEKSTRGTNRRLVLWLLFFFAALLGMIPLGDYIDQHSKEYRWLGAVFGFGLMGFLVCNMILLAVIGRKHQNKFGHRCPRCNKPLSGFLARLAIATGNCGYCGEPVFDKH